MAKRIPRVKKDTRYFYARMPVGRLTDPERYTTLVYTQFILACCARVTTREGKDETASEQRERVCT